MSSNFWGDSKSEPANLKKSTKKSFDTRFYTFRFSWGLFVGVFFLIAIIIAAVFINLKVDNSGTTGSIIDTIRPDNGDLDINWDRYPTADIELSDSFTITKSGTYHLTGTLENGQITIDSQNISVRLILDNVSMSNSTGPVIYSINAEDLVIETIGENYLSDDASYSSDYDSTVTGTIFSKNDLTFQGDGILNVTANYADAIVGKDDLKFNSGTYNLTAHDDTIRGTDSVYVVSGDFTLNAGADGIKSTNDLDSDKGFVLIENGNFHIDSVAKGIKSARTILIYGGTFEITTKDDSIHSDIYVAIVGGAYTINSSDDGIHANTKLIIDGGSIDILSSYEGIESQSIIINNGEISVKATDDGFNAGGGADSSASTGRTSGNPGTFDSDADCILTFNGGTIYVDAAGDGIDSNGYIYINGGDIIVDGPTNNGNGAIDSGIGVEMNGGSVIAVGSSGMVETLGDTGSVLNISAYFSSNQPAGTKIEIKNSAGEIILSHESAKAFTNITAGSPAFTLGETYSIYLNDELSETFTINDTTTIVGQSNQNFNHMMRR